MAHSSDSNSISQSEKVMQSVREGNGSYRLVQGPRLASSEKVFLVRSLIR